MVSKPVRITAVFLVVASAILTTACAEAAWFNWLGFLRPEVKSAAADAEKKKTYAERHKPKPKQAMTPVSSRQKAADRAAKRQPEESWFAWPSSNKSPQKK